MYNCSDYCFNQGPFLSPAQFERFIHPFLRRQTQALRGEGAYVVKHTDGNIWPILDMLLDCGPHCIHSVDPIASMDLGALKRRTSGRCALMGNVNSALLHAGDRAGILKSARQALKQGMQSPGYIFSTCNSVFEGIALEDYRLMLGVRDEMGSYRSEG
jgi:uroporphyrinogen decarboxylase